ncbi:hypothetical protein B4N89_34955 [Embleya scabrispora]|uniref:Major facilitator superfamily (MFS) profile domain-containing protein n=1 Tax=Embleya scabrispora TaxID=159449 RepID=A0A1T3NR09_9ACTN|nr:MFS transporter [Embleya scabrispora]OPC79259.1 hypothetical protein B4N89_34955 [Embleya scabrispora]
MAHHTAASVGARLDRIPLSGFHRRLVLALAGMILFEWVEAYSFAFVAPVLRDQWHISLRTVGVIAGVTSLGAFAGGVAAGYLADRIGRRRTMLGFSVTYCVFAVLCAFVQGPGQLVIARTLAQFGTQGMAVCAIVVLTEFVPARARGRLQTRKVVIGAMGIPIAAWTSYFVVPHWSWGWRLVFGIGAVGVVFAVLVWRWVPESPRWLVTQGRTAEAEAIVAAIERASGVGAGAGMEGGAGRAPGLPDGGEGSRPEAVGEADAADDAVGDAHAVVAADAGSPAPPAVSSAGQRRTRVAELWTGPHRRTFLVTTAMWVTGLAAYSAFNTWTPTLLEENGLELSDTLLVSAVLATAAPLGSLLAAPLIDRWERTTSLLVLCLISAGLLLLFGVTHARAAILVLGCLVTLLFHASTPFLQIYSAEVFPTSIRALGSGTANALSRIVNFGGPMLIAAIYAGLGYAAVFAWIALLAGSGGVIAHRFGPRTTGRPLEALGRTASDTPAEPTGSPQATPPSSTM